jgi:hypothetical protein
LTEERLFVELLLVASPLEVVTGLEFTFSLEVVEDLTPSLVLELVVDAPSLNDVLLLESLLRTEEILSFDERVDSPLPDEISEREPEER